MEWSSWWIDGGGHHIATDRLVIDERARGHRTQAGGEDEAVGALPGHNDGSVHVGVMLVGLSDEVDERLLAVEIDHVKLVARSQAYATGRVVIPPGVDLSLVEGGLEKAVLAGGGLLAGFERENGPPHRDIGEGGVKRREHDKMVRSDPGGCQRDSLT